MITRPASETLTVVGLPAFTDNYLWLVHDGQDAAVVDPGDAEVVAAALQARKLRLRTILVTHHHPDHTGGIEKLKATSGATVYAPAMEAEQIPAVDQLLHDGDAIQLPMTPELKLSVVAVPGHTLGHIAYHAADAGWLFCGDTLFSGGCGRLFEGSPEQMHTSLERLAALPDDTQVYCAHEYTLANLEFAHAVEPKNTTVASALRDTATLRDSGWYSIPSTIGRERRINPFLRCADPGLVAALQAHDDSATSNPVDVFAGLRRWKDTYRG